MRIRYLMLAAAATLLAQPAQAEPLAPGLSPQADAAISEAEHTYREDPLLTQLRRDAYDLGNIKAARGVLDRLLIDYPSARFRDVVAYYIFAHNRQVNKDGTRNPPILVYCGMVNARNRMGGMVGWQSQAWAPWGEPDFDSCPGSITEQGFFARKVVRIGPVGDDALAEAFDPARQPDRPSAP